MRSSEAALPMKRSYFPRLMRQNLCGHHNSLARTLMSACPIPNQKIFSAPVN
jgi:hypothetical protein